MGETRTERETRISVVIGLLAALWLVGTTTLLSLALKELLRLRYAVQFTDQEPDSLLEEYAIAAAIIGIAAPAAGAIIAEKTGRGGIAALFGVGAALCMIVVLAFVSGMQGSPQNADRIRSVHTEPAMVCTVPPEKVLEVPGC
ncbi:hypothetical protein ITP53_09530 [Nonomuraea sp. K274]|uniref:Uncharacterized protein n=1 Tax=Nonomuraea cypriaca TaxID=1187855 RepID=A0A931A494_9ACTN|nr:hypothetical protein [Nonomuraea cypriaca]MBF8185981.1 hypothetical protein [Nonomuraea cypriaca]